MQLNLALLRLFIAPTRIVDQTILNKTIPRLPLIAVERTSFFSSVGDTYANVTRQETIPLLRAVHP
jgi:hypothetical protein